MRWLQEITGAPTGCRLIAVLLSISATALLVPVSGWACGYKAAGLPAQFDLARVNRSNFPARILVVLPESKARRGAEKMAEALEKVGHDVVVAEKVPEDAVVLRFDIVMAPLEAAQALGAAERQAVIPMVETVQQAFAQDASGSVVLNDSPHNQLDLVEKVAAELKDRVGAKAGKPGA